MATLMTFQLQNLAMDSMMDYTHLISQDPVGEHETDWVEVNLIKNVINV